MATEVDRTGIDMSASHEPSYYEIALTNRQVVVAFIILLICLVASFLSGVWIGREGTARAQDRLAHAYHADQMPGSPLAPAAAAPAGDADKDGQALQEFKFFNDSKRKAGKDGETQPSRPAKEAVEPSGEGEALQNRGTPAAPRQAAAPAGADPLPAAGPASGTHEGAAAPSPKRTRHGEGAGADGPSNTGAAEPAAGEPVRARPLPDAPVAAAAAASDSRSGGEVVIQVFSSADKTQAEALRSRLVKAGQKAYLSPIEKSGRVMYRVRIGPFTSRDDADQVADQVRREQKLDTWITPK